MIIPHVHNRKLGEHVRLMGAQQSPVKHVRIGIKIIPLNVPIVKIPHVHHKQWVQVVRDETKQCMVRVVVCTGCKREREVKPCSLWWRSPESAFNIPRCRPRVRRVGDQALQNHLEYTLCGGVELNELPFWLIRSHSIEIQPSDGTEHTRKREILMPFIGRDYPEIQVLWLICLHRESDRRGHQRALPYPCLAFDFFDFQQQQCENRQIY